jgi:glycosyltransferase A (GT-A) superfamily protein (DUF2064 family)
VAGLPLSGAVLLIAPDPDAGAGGVRPQLVDLLGPARCAALGRLLITRAARWAADVAPGRVYVAAEATAADSVLALASDDARLIPVPGAPSAPAPEAGAAPGAGPGAGVSERLAGAVARAWTEAEDGPLLVVWPDLPRWRAEHARSALDDLAAGCGVSVGPVFDGGFYLLALQRPVPSLFELAAEAWSSPDAMGLALDVIHRAGLETGLLRTERGLRRAADVRAALADPLLDPELRSILQG